jgi:membrane protein DedA with SNARE-associated domain
VLFNALGAALWVLTWTVAGYYVGLHGAEIAALTHKVGYAGVAAALIAAAAALAVVIVRRIGRRRNPPFDALE